MKAKRPEVKVDLVRRAEVLAVTEEYCDNWNKHPQHDRVIRLSNWIGGGTHTMTCPGHKRKHP